MTDYILAQTSTQIQSAITKVLEVPGSKLGSEYYIDVKTYGATGNGITDDTAAIQAAIDTCGVAGGGVVFFPTGTYKFSTLHILNERVSLVGAGRGATTLFKTGTGDGICVGSSSVGVSKINIENMLIVGTAAGANSNLVVIQNAGAIYLNNIYFFSAGKAITIDYGVWDIHVSNFIMDGLTDGLVIGANGNSTTGILPQDIFVSNGVISNCSEDAIQIYVTSGVYVQNVDCAGNTRYGIYIAPTSSNQTQGCFFTNVLTDSGGYGLVVLGPGKIRHISFVNCWFSSSVNHGIFSNPGANSYDLRIEGGGIVSNGKYGVCIQGVCHTKVSGCGIFNNGTGANNTYDSVHVVAAATNFDISDNKIGWTEGSNKPTCAVYIETGASDYYKIENNTLFAHAVTQCIIDGGTGLNKRVRSNLGFKNEALGTDTISSGASSKAVTHGLVATPTKISVTGSTADTNALYVDTIGASTFTVHSSGAVGGNRVIYWKAEV